MEAQEQKQKDIKKGHLPENNLPLEQPHRDKASIAKWLMDAVSEIMTFTSPDPQTDLAHHLAYFSPAGQQEFQAFLVDTAIQPVLDDRRYVMRGFVQTTPRFLNEGVIDGRYRWLYEVPVMVSSLERSQGDYKNGGEAVNRKMIIRLQVGRSDSAENDAGILIEHWTGKAVGERN